MYLIKNVLVTFTVIMALAVSFAPRMAHAYEVNSNVEVSDPLEPVNRAIYGFNMFLDKILIKPAAKAYRFVVPDVARRGVRNFLINLTEPVTFANSVLQGDVNNSYTSFWRFGINSTFGICGLFDVARYGGLEHRSEDFGQTMGRYGVGHGPYIIIPIIGPSNTRDLFGRVADSFSDPYNYLVETDGVIGRELLDGLDTRESLLDLLDDIERTSLDPYATVRSLYTQKRDDEIKNGGK